jgi:hypothetical protein
MMPATVEIPVATPMGRGQARGRSLSRDAAKVAAWTLGFFPVLYLALRGGGYDLVVRSQMGLAAWWIGLLGVLVGVMPLQRLGRLACVAVGLLGAFALWTGTTAAGGSPLGVVATGVTSSLGYDHYSPKYYTHAPHAQHSQPADPASHQRGPQSM